MFTHKSLCPITGLEIQPYREPDEDFRGLRYFIPSISGKLLISIAENVLQNSNLRGEMIDNREKFEKNLKMVSRLRQEIFVSSGNWWLFLK